MVCSALVIKTGAGLPAYLRQQFLAKFLRALHDRQSMYTFIKVVLAKSTHTIRMQVLPVVNILFSFIKLLAFL